MKEVSHIIGILTRAKYALEQGDTGQLRDLSDRTIHSASVYQHTDYILLATVIYTLSKLLERREKIKIKNWNEFIRGVGNLLSLAVSSIQRNKYKQFIRVLIKTKNYIENSSSEIKPYVSELLRKASINKASKVYEHGISLSKTTKLLGVTPWELSEYIGGKESSELKLNKTLEVKDRISLAMEFFK